MSIRAVILSHVHFLDSKGHAQVNITIDQIQLVCMYVRQRTEPLPEKRDYFNRRQLLWSRA